MKTMAKAREPQRVEVQPLWLEELGTWTLQVDHCPYCGFKHRHGGGNDWRDQIGTRREAGCLSGGTYILTALEDWTKPRERARGDR